MEKKIANYCDEFYKKSSYIEIIIEISWLFVTTAFNYYYLCTRNKADQKTRTIHGLSTQVITSDRAVRPFTATRSRCPLWQHGVKHNSTRTLSHRYSFSPDATAGESQPHFDFRSVQAKQTNRRENEPNAKGREKKLPELGMLSQNNQAQDTVSFFYVSSFLCPNRRDSELWEEWPRKTPR